MSWRNEHGISTRVAGEAQEQVSNAPANENMKLIKQTKTKTKSIRIIFHE